MTASVEIDAVGMATPLGLGAASACAAMRAGIDRKRELPLLDDTGEPIIGSALSTLPASASRPERCLGLLSHALRDLRAGVPSVDSERTALLLKLPRGHGGMNIPLPELARVASQALATSIDVGRLYVADDDVDAYQLIAAARARVQAGDVNGCVVCATDSLIDLRSLSALVRLNRLKTPANADGLIPGEAAACVRLVRRGARTLARVRGFGTAVEVGLLSNDVPLRGDGIVRAARNALKESGMTMDELDFRLSDATGEAYFFREQTLALARLLRQNKATFPLWLVAHPLGHVGQAAGLCSLVWAVIAWARGYAPGPRAIASTGADDGRRSVLILERGGL